MSDQNEQAIPSGELAEKKEQFIKLIKGISLFEALEKNEINEICKKAKIIEYEIGQSISFADIIQNKIIINLEGTARLLDPSNSNLETIAKLGPGSIIGLGSLLRNSPCERVTASSKVKALVIPDEFIINTYKNNQAFNYYCNNLLNPCEVLALSNIILNQSNRTDLSLKLIFNNIYKNTKLISSKKYFDLKITEDKIVFIASSNIKNFKIGDILNSNTKQNFEINNYFCGRLLTLPLKLHNQLINKTETEDIQSLSNNDDNSRNINLDIEKASSKIEKSTFDFDTNSQGPKKVLIRAKGEIQELVATLEMLSNELDFAFRRDTTEKIIREEIRMGKKISMPFIGKLLSVGSLYSRYAQISAKNLNQIPTPSIIFWNKICCLLTKSDSESITINSPREGILKIKQKDLNTLDEEKYEILHAQKSNLSPNKKFGLNWFLPSLKKYKSTLILVLIASFVVQLFGLANPLLIQVIIDKVISQRSLDTLQVLGIALVVVTILGGLISSLRTFLFTETTNRIDMRLGAEVIDHLLRLPLNYFDKRPVGELGSRVSELEKIREFLTGQALTTILDAAFSVIYIIVMFIYSSLLTFLALAVIPIQIGLTLLGSPLIRRQIREVANKNAQTQSHLIEVLTGVQTVKAQNVETISRWKWQDLYSKYISRTFEKTITGTLLVQTSQVFQQLSQLLVLWVGASLVLKGQLTLGQLIAFRIISGYVTQPILRLSSIWQNLQELKVSFERLADIIDTQEESSEEDKGNIPLPEIKGKVEYKNISFSFNKDSEKILKKINLSIEPGKFIGIAGQSGSGKSTLMKLLPRLYETSEGKILIDGYDINKVELYSLRRQVGIVPQEPLLFSGSITENISINNPDVSSDDVVKAARLADAHSFIMDLPSGYSTKVGERGSSLSGGQRQRIAIARTLLSNPRLLIMDEATSALDYETEKRVCENIKNECKNITVFFITHRLSTIQKADMILLMHQGSIHEIGSHSELMDKKGRYFALYRQQESV